MPNNIEQELKTVEGAGRVVIAGIGNPIRREIMSRLKIVEKLNGKLKDNVHLIEAETVPESYLQDIQEFQPTHVL
jgi:Ni,Fe-hydrogenase maturation factor